MARSFGKACVAVLAGVLCGCGGDPYETVEVTGKVTCEGRPAEGGFVVFEPIDAPEKTGRPQGNPGRVSRGMIQEDGSYTLIMDARAADAATTGALAGPHRVSFIAPITEPVKMNPADKALPAEEQEQIKADLAKIPVFKPLACGTTITPSEVEVEAGGSALDFTLAPGRPEPPRRPSRGAGSD